MYQKETISQNFANYTKSKKRRNIPFIFSSVGLTVFLALFILSRIQNKYLRSDFYMLYLMAIERDEKHSETQWKYDSLQKDIALMCNYIEFLEADNHKRENKLSHYTPTPDWSWEPGWEKCSSSAEYNQFCNEKNALLQQISQHTK